MKKVLITGIAGSGGSYLAEYLVQNQDVEVHGISRWHSTTSVSNLKNIKDNIIMHECDLNDLSATIRAIEASKPDSYEELCENEGYNLDEIEQMKLKLQSHTE